MPRAPTRAVPLASAAAWFLVLAIGLSWPLAAHLASHVPGESAGDNVVFVWNAWWMRQALWTDASFFHTHALLIPFGASLVQHTHTALPALAGATALAGLPVVVALNVTTIASIALNGICAWALAWHMTRQQMAALLAGTAFASAPYFGGHLLGHFNLMAAWVLPLFLLLFVPAVRLGSRTRAALAGLTLVAAAYTDYYYLAYLLVLLGLVTAHASLVVRAGRRPARGARDRVALACVVLGAAAVAAAAWIAWTGGTTFVVGGQEIRATSGRNLRTAAWLFFGIAAWRRARPSIVVAGRGASAAAPALRAAGLALAVFVAGAAPLMAAAAALWRAGAYASQPYQWLSAPPGIDLASLLAGNPFHPIWGGASAALHAAIGSDVVERTAWLGVVPIAAAAAVLSSRARRRDAGLWFAMLVLFLVWALGPRLVTFGADTGLILPATAVRFVPVLSNVRIPARAIVGVYLALAMLTAIWWGSRSRPAWAGWLLIGAVLVDFMPAPIPLYRLATPAIYAELDALGPGGVLELPVGVRDGFGEIGYQRPETMYFQTVHGRPITGGMVARVPAAVKSGYRESPVLGPLVALSAGETPAATGRPVTAGDLVALGVRFVMVDVSASPPALLEHVRTALPIRLVTARAGYELYRVE